MRRAVLTRRSLRQVVAFLGAGAALLAAVAAGWVARSNRYAARRRSFYLPMRDGVRLAVDVYLPKDLAPGERVPAVLHQTRYFRRIDYRWPASLLIPADFVDMMGLRRRFVPGGYAWVTVDVRGTGASFGRLTGPFPTELIDDARELVDWIVRQPWSDGRVGTIGISYDGACAELTLASGHPALKAAIPAFIAFDMYSDLSAPGGALIDWFLRTWGRFVQALDQNAIGDVTGRWTRLLVRGVQPVDDDRDRSLLRAAISEHASGWAIDEAMESVVFRDDPLPTDPKRTIDSFSAHSYAAQIEALGAAVYSYTGWFDGAHAHAAVKRFLTVRTPGSRLTIGPWDHAGLHEYTPRARRRCRFDHAGEFRAFFDRHFKEPGATGASQRPVRYYTLVADEWRQSETWPPPGAEPVPYYFGPDGRLSLDPPSASEASDVYRVDTSVGTGELARWRFMARGNGNVPYGDRAEQDRRLLTYTSPPLDRDTEVTGHPLVTLWISSTARDGLFFVYLEDVDAEGRVTYVTEGELRALHRRLSDAPPPYRDVVPYRTFKRADACPLVPDEIAELIFDLLPTSYVFRRGHAIRVALAGADRDNFVVLPGDPPTITVYRDALHVSRVVLPVMRGG